MEVHLIVDKDNEMLLKSSCPFSDWGEAFRYAKDNNMGNYAVRPVTIDFMVSLKIERNDAR